MPANIVAVVLQFCPGMENKLPDGTSISTGRIVKIAIRRAVACKVSGVKEV